MCVSMSAWPQGAVQASTSARDLDGKGGDYVRSEIADRLVLWWRRMSQPIQCVWITSPKRRLSRTEARENYYYSTELTRNATASMRHHCNPKPEKRSKVVRSSSARPQRPDVQMRQLAKIMRCFVSFRNCGQLLGEHSSEALDALPTAIKLILTVASSWAAEVEQPCGESCWHYSKAWSFFEPLSPESSFDAAEHCALSLEYIICMIGKPTPHAFSITSQVKCSS